jgi:ElaB/YqjD/DUF883 family membrane-anchored ribosome-binding protein
MEQTNSENIVDALKLLDHEAKQKKDELRTVMSNKYMHLKGLIVDDEPGLMKSWTIAKDHALQGAVDFKDAGIEKARGIAGGVDRNVHGNPWYYIAGSAGVGILLGYILGRIRVGSR